MSFLVVSGVCRPQTFEALELFKGIQRETNRVLDSLDKSLIYVDGRIGDKTRQAVNTALNGGYKNCSEIANNAKAIYGVLKQQADARQLAIVADPESIVRSVVSPPSNFDHDTGKVIHPSASIAGIPLWAIALTAVGGGYYLYKTPGGKKVRKSLTGAF